MLLSTQPDQVVRRPRVVDHLDLDVQAGEVVGLIGANGAGLSDAEVAGRLTLGEGTVKTHVGHVFAKLDLRDRASAVVWAFDHGLVRPGQR